LKGKSAIAIARLYGKERNFLAMGEYLLSDPIGARRELINAIKTAPFNRQQLMTPNAERVKERARKGCHRAAIPAENQRDLQFSST
jgi:hypothetical protein